jgi:hypothetical protein
MICLLIITVYPLYIKPATAISTNTARLTVKRERAQ